MSEMLSVPVAEPDAVGVNVTLTVQLASTARSVSEVHVPAFAPDATAKGPVTPNPVRPTGTFPVLETVTVCGALVVFTACAAKVRLAGFRATVPAVPAPVPVKVTICGLPVALSVKVIAPVRAPAAVGVKVIWNVQVVAPDGIIGHCARVAPAKSPVVVMFVKVTVEPLLLETVTVCAALVVFKF